MKKQIEIKWNEDENGKDQIKVFVDNELIVTQHSLSAVALAEVLCKVGCEVYISSQWMKNHSIRRKYKPHSGHVIQR